MRQEAGRRQGKQDRENLNKTIVQNLLKSADPRHTRVELMEEREVASVTLSELPFSVCVFFFVFSNCRVDRSLARSACSFVIS